MAYDLIIIGGGPAGITAGIYAGRQNIKTLLITKEFGGQIGKKAVDIENYSGFEKISGPDLIERFIKQLKKQTVEIKLSEVVKIEKNKDGFVIITAEKEKISGLSVIIATGADPRPLEVPGEKEFIGKGISYCATCDGPVFKDKTIAVIGGGNAGFETALFMENYAKKIYILEQGSEMKADFENQKEVKKSKKITLITNALIKEIKGGKIVESLVYEDLLDKKTPHQNPEGEQVPYGTSKFGTGQAKTLDVQGVFVEIGTQPATSLVKGLVDFNDKDEIKTEFETFQTKTPGLFAVGDVNSGKYKQIITAAGEGCKAALAAYEYVRRTKK